MKRVFDFIAVAAVCFLFCGIDSLVEILFRVIGL